MRKINLWRTGIICMFISMPAVAKPHCSKEALTDKVQQPLSCYISESEDTDQPWVFNHKKYNETRKVSIETYQLASQNWPKAEMSTHGLLWKHSLIIYKPYVVKTNQALLFVNSDTRYAKSNKDNSQTRPIDFARIAAETDSIVVDLRDIPNQYLTFDDNVPRKEDGIVAYTWNRYMDNPDKSNGCRTRYYAL